MRMPRTALIAVVAFALVALTLVATVGAVGQPPPAASVATWAHQSQVDTGTAAAAVAAADGAADLEAARAAIEEFDAAALGCLSEGDGASDCVWDAVDSLLWDLDDALDDGSDDFDHLDDFDDCGEFDEFDEVSSETIEEFTCVASPAEPALLFFGFGETGGGLNLPSGTSLRIIVAVIVVLAAAGVVTVLGGRRILNPIAELTGAAKRMEQGRLTARVSATGGDEIGQLAQAFNSMADALERSDGERRMLTSDIAHELRTPLSNIRGYLEAIQDSVVEASPDVIAAVHEEALLLQQLVDDLQALALADAGEPRLHREPTDLAALIEQAVTSHQAKAEASGVRVTAVSAAVPSVSLDPVRVRQVIGNLIDNAIRYTPRGGSVTVTVFAAEGHVSVSVADTGEGIAPDHLPHVFDRFYRPDSSRSRATGGSGLGLAIVQQLVTAHGGEVAIESTLGAGTTVIVTFARDAAGLP